jgi:hypothetical protein
VSFPVVSTKHASIYKQDRLQHGTVYEAGNAATRTLVLSDALALESALVLYVDIRLGVAACSERIISVSGASVGIEWCAGLAIVSVRTVGRSVQALLISSRKRRAHKPGAAGGGGAARVQTRARVIACEASLCRHRTHSKRPESQSKHIVPCMQAR